MEEAIKTIKELRASCHKRFNLGKGVEKEAAKHNMKLCDKVLTLMQPTPVSQANELVAELTKKIEDACCIGACDTMVELTTLIDIRKALQSQPTQINKED